MYIAGGKLRPLYKADRSISQQLCVLATNYICSLLWRKMYSAEQELQLYMIPAVHTHPCNLQSMTDWWWGSIMPATFRTNSVVQTYCSALYGVCLKLVSSCLTFFPLALSYFEASLSKHRTQTYLKTNFWVYLNTFLLVWPLITISLNYSLIFIY